MSKCDNNKKSKTVKVKPYIKNNKIVEGHKRSKPCKNKNHKHI